MIDYVVELLGIDLTASHISDVVLFVIVALFVLFVIGEMFNIVRTVLAYFFGKR